MKSTLVLQSFGKETEYRRAILTVLSYYAYVNLPYEQTKVLLFTDNTEYFKPFFQGLQVEFVFLTPKKIKEMRGEIDFLHRMKIALIEEAFNLTNGNILYADSDTFFIADPEPLMDQLQEDKSFMHLWEYRFEELRDWKLPAGQSFRDFLQLIETRTFSLASGREISLSPNHVSWNAGVMMFHHSHARFLPDVYALTEQFYPATRNHASEQYAFSIVLQENTQIKACDSVIYHYWYRIKKQIIDQLLNKELSVQWAQQPLEQKLRIVKAWTAMLPAYLEEHVWTKRDFAIQAFNEDRFKEGYQWAVKAFLQKPLGSSSFLRDTLYHFKRHLKGY